MKTCTKCKEFKPLQDFHFANKAKDKYQACCKICASIIRKVSYRKNPDHHYRVARERKARLKKEYIEFKKTLSCELCGENHPQCLEFHHKDPSQKEFVISLYANYGIEKVKTEIAKCSILCANCHRKQHFS